MSQILKGIAENGTPDQSVVLEELASFGCDADALLAKARAIIEDHKRSNRRQWMDVARARQAQAEGIAQKVTDWGKRTTAEVETAGRRARGEPLRCGTSHARIAVQTQRDCTGPYIRLVSPACSRFSHYSYLRRCPVRAQYSRRMSFGVFFRPTTRQLIPKIEWIEPSLIVKNTGPHHGPRLYDFRKILLAKHQPVYLRRKQIVSTVPLQPRMTDRGFVRPRQP
jgi:hypothetical protein